MNFEHPIDDTDPENPLQRKEAAMAFFAVFNPARPQHPLALKHPVEVAFWTAICRYQGLIDPEGVELLTDAVVDHITFFTPEELQ